MEQRLVIEFEHLVSRITKLESFIDGENFPELSEEQAKLLLDQLAFMKGYRECLRARIVALIKNNKC